MLRRAAAILLACYHVLTKCPVLRERGSRRVAPGCGRSRLASVGFLVSPLRGPSSAGPGSRGCRHLGSSMTSGRDPVRLLSRYSFLTGVYSAFIGRDFAHRGLSCRSFSGLEVLLFRPGPVHSTGAPH
ncbi:hypothetical protein NDU88_003997 [Pleurodeles waltl]|uniref:Secreted protein n=1 Tax=Pleurodeles waltl TaxID=8319 RepID=A0AAV7QEU2_PLEWA|nr:hypothetical protein NDU88_003997 [Pleurodeles waltl]